jgi:prepilin-type N-terminal cleavage/methylation domain-containing protein
MEQRERLRAFTLLATCAFPRHAVALAKADAFRSSVCSFGSRHSSHVTRHSAAFTLLELLVVITIIALLMVLVAPALNTIKGGSDATAVAYTIRGLLEQARTYAKANNTYAWVGFFEELNSISSTNPATAGLGRIVICTVASRDGTKVYSSVASPAADMDGSGARLSQIGKLVKLDNFHLRTFPAGTGTTPADTFPTRPPVPGLSPDNARIGDTSPPDSLRYFHYPPNGLEANAQYKFKKMVQFSPRGECRPQNDNYDIRTVMEIGFQPVRGTVLDDAKDCAIQLTGFGGNVQIYQR